MAFQECADRWRIWFIHIHRGDRRLSYLYAFCGCALQVVPNAKHLGVTIRDNLEWQEQIKRVVKKAKNSLHFIFRNLKHYPRKEREVAFCSITHSSHEYCSSIWDPRLKKDKDNFEKVNQRRVHMVYN